MIIPDKYYKTIITDEYILDFKKGLLVIKKSGETCNASWEVLDYLKREYWSRKREEYNFSKMTVSYELDLKECEGLKLKDTIKAKEHLVDYGIEEYLSKLTPLQKNVIKMMFEKEMKLVEIAQKTGTSPENIHNIKERALNRIRNSVEKEWEMER